MSHFSVIKTITTPSFQLFHFLKSFKDGLIGNLFCLVLLFFVNVHSILIFLAQGYEPFKFCIEIIHLICMHFALECYRVFEWVGWCTLLTLLSVRCRCHPNNRLRITRRTNWKSLWLGLNWLEILLGACRRQSRISNSDTLVPTIIINSYFKTIFILYLYLFGLWHLRRWYYLIWKIFIPVYPKSLFMFSK